MASRHIAMFGIKAGLFAGWFGLWAIPAVHADPVRSALVIANDSYTTLPALSSCAVSANAVSAVLRDLGYDVTIRTNASTGAIIAGIGDFARRVAEGGGPAVTYACGYGAACNDRLFLLPVSARLTRQSDVLSQGILLKSLLNTVDHSGVPAAVTVLDIMRQPEGTEAVSFAPLSDIAVSDGVGFIAVTQAAPAGGVSPLAAALAASLKTPFVRSDTLIEGLRGQVAGVVAAHLPVKPDYLADSPPPPAEAAPPPTAVEAPAPPPAPPPASQAEATPPAEVQSAIPPGSQLPDDEEMTDADRRVVQAALGRLGYYSRQADGIFGADTRAAIRRYQHEIGAEMTGRLTGNQATRLAATP